MAGRGYVWGDGFRQMLHRADNNIELCRHSVELVLGHLDACQFGKVLNLLGGDGRHDSPLGILSILYLVYPPARRYADVLVI